MIWVDLLFIVIFMYCSAIIYNASIRSPSQDKKLQNILIQRFAIQQKESKAKQIKPKYGYVMKLFAMECIL